MHQEGKRDRPSGDWEDRTEQRAVPSDELLDAMKHPDVPEVVLEAIARRSSIPPVHEVARDPGEDTARYLLGRGAPLAARIAEAGSLPPETAARVRVRAEQPEPLFPVIFMGFLMVAAVVGWWSFGLLPR